MLPNSFFNSFARQAISPDTFDRQSNRALFAFQRNWDAHFFVPFTVYFPAVLKAATSLAIAQSRAPGRFDGACLPGSFMKSANFMVADRRFNKIATAQRSSSVYVEAEVEAKWREKRICAAIIILYDDDYDDNLLVMM